MFLTLLQINGTANITTDKIVSKIIIDCAKECPCGVPTIPVPDEVLEVFVVGGFKVWHIILIVIAFIISMVVMYCCFHRCRIPRTKQEIEADLMRSNMSNKFREHLQNLPPETATFIEALKKVQEMEEKFEQEQLDAQGAKKRMGWLKLKGKDDVARQQPADIGEKKDGTQEFGKLLSEELKLKFGEGNAETQMQNDNDATDRNGTSTIPKDIEAATTTTPEGEKFPEETDSLKELRAKLERKEKLTRKQRKRVDDADKLKDKIARKISKRLKLEEKLKKREKLKQEAEEERKKKKNEKNEKKAAAKKSSAEPSPEPQTSGLNKVIIDKRRVNGISKDDIPRKEERRKEERSPSATLTNRVKRDENKDTKRKSRGRTRDDGKVLSEENRKSQKDRHEDGHELAKSTKSTKEKEAGKPDKMASELIDQNKEYEDEGKTDFRVNQDKHLKSKAAHDRISTTTFSRGYQGNAPIKRDKSFTKLKVESYKIDGDVVGKTPLAVAKEEPPETKKTSVIGFNLDAIKSAVSISAVDDEQNTSQHWHEKAKHHHHKRKLKDEDADHETVIDSKTTRVQQILSAERDDVDGAKTRQSHSVAVTQKTSKPDQVSIDMTAGMLQPEFKKHKKIVKRTTKVISSQSRLEKLDVTDAPGEPQSSKIWSSKSHETHKVEHYPRIEESAPTQTTSTPSTSNLLELPLQESHHPSSHVEPHHHHHHQQQQQQQQQQQKHYHQHHQAVTFKHVLSKDQKRRHYSKDRKFAKDK